MFGIANQLLAAIALAVGTSIILQAARKKSYALVTFLPFIFVFVTTIVAGIETLPPWPESGLRIRRIKGYSIAG